MKPQLLDRPHLGQVSNFVSISKLGFGWSARQRLAVSLGIYCLVDELRVLQTSTGITCAETGTPHDEALKGREHPKRANA